MANYDDVICPICWWRKFKHKYWGKDYSYKTSDKKYEIIECQNCELEQQYPLPSIEEQYSFYGWNYYSYNAKKLNKFSAREIWLNIEYFIFSIFENRKLKLPKYRWNWKYFLDVGCWDWMTLDILEKLGRNTRWFEISEEPKFKDNIYYADSIVNVDFDEKYDLILSSASFEHVYNPIPFLKKLKEILKDDGNIIMILPNVKSLSCKIFWPYHVARDIPRHIYGYNYKNIVKLFDKMWFEVIFKSKRREAWLAPSLAWMLIWKYNIDIRNNVLYYILWILFIPIEFILSIFRNTSNMWFVLKKK
jgi:SAM-dependent methyltransferase